MKKQEFLENITVEKLVFGGKGFARHSDGRVIFITGGVVPGSIVNLRVLKKKKDYIETQVLDVVKKSNLEKVHPNNIYGECGGCKRVNIPYSEQLKIKENQVKESLNLLKKYTEKYNENSFSSILPSPLVDGYRNKVEFSFGKLISAKAGLEEHFNVGFHKQGSFSQVQDFEGCILIDDLANKIYKKIKDFSKTTGLPVYDQKTGEGFFRHILLRRTFFANEVMIVFSFNDKYLNILKENKIGEKQDFSSSPILGDYRGNSEIPQIKSFFLELAKEFYEIKSIYLSYNSNKADIAIGELELIYGEKTIKEKLLDLTFEISPTSFFQTNSYGAELLYSKVLEMVDNSQPHPTVLDLYGGTGTIGMVFAKAGAKKVYSVELVKSASQDGQNNTKKNNLENIEFINAKVEDFLEDYLKTSQKADLLIIDPPRAGMHPSALPNILKFDSEQIIYVSCNPSTLARDLEYILKNSDYKIEKVLPVDMFPHTHHIETIISLKKV